MKPVARLGHCHSLISSKKIKTLVVAETRTTPTLYYCANNSIFTTGYLFMCGVTYVYHKYANRGAYQCFIYSTAIYCSACMHAQMNWWMGVSDGIFPPACMEKVHMWQQIF